MAKKHKISPKVQFEECNKSCEDAKKMLLEDKSASSEPVPDKPVDAQEATGPQTQGSDSIQGTLTSSESTKRRLGAGRGVCALHKVVAKKARGKKYKVRYNQLGNPIGDTRAALQSYIGMSARSMIPIDIAHWRKVDPELKRKLWLDVLDTFELAQQSEDMVLKSAGTKWRQFKTKLTTKHVLPYIGQKTKLMKPPKQYAFVGKKVWKRFVTQRTDEKWLLENKKQSDRVKKRKYHHRLSRKGYIGLQEEEIKKGNLEPEEIPDRAIFWKKARLPKDENEKIDEELVKINAKIDALLKQKEKGDFKPSGSEDVLSAALDTPEHSGRVRGVGGYVTPRLFFNLPITKRTRVTKSELLARDRQRDEELQKIKQDFLAQIADLKALITASNLHSPMMSDKSSCQPLQEEGIKVKPPIAKELMVDDVCHAVVDPTPSTEKKGPRACELAVDTIENKVAFGMVFDDGVMGQTIHGVPLQPGHARVSVDGIIQPDALVPVPIAGEIETVHQAVGSHIAWPRELIVFPTAAVVKKKREVQQSKSKNELQRLQVLFSTVELNENVPSRYKFLYKHATTFMKASGASIQIPCDAEVFGIEKTIFVLDENLVALLQFDMVGQAAISAYMAYLHTLIRKDRKNDDVIMYGFFDPTATITINNEFEPYIVNRLKEGNYNRIYFMPHNHKAHWILLILWDGDIYILNPLSHPVHFVELEKALSDALISYNAQTGRPKRAPAIKYLGGSPKQPGGHECGYVVMRYMRDMILDKEMSYFKKFIEERSLMRCV